MSVDPLAGLEPALLWERFFELTRISRPSKQEGPAREHVLAWAAARGLDARVQTRRGTWWCACPASTGRDAAPTVVLQSHLDMVCERDPSSPFDPREGRIDVRVEDDWVRAEGTTLGADNGIGVAAAMAVADDDAILHGPLELLFTVSEEQGLDGAKALDASLVSGRMLVNLDGTSDEALTVGCAGSDHTLLRIPLTPSSARADHVALRVEVSGAKGGHSGGDITAGRVNAIKALARVLSAAFEAAPFELSALDGGVSRNAIPRDAAATVAVPQDAEQAFRAAAEAELAAIARQYAGTDDGLALEIAPETRTELAGAETTRRVLDLMAAIPSGVLAMSPDLTGVVETSTSLTTATTKDGTLTLGSMTRSSNAAALDEVLATMARAGSALRSRDRSAPLVSTVGAAARLTAPRDGDEHVHAALRLRARARGGARRARVRGARPEAPGRRDDLDRPRDGRAARPGRESADLEHRALLPAPRGLLDDLSS